MSLKTIGTIAIPGAAGSEFDHAAFDAKSRRVFIAHTARDCIEVIDHDAGKHLATVPGFPGQPAPSPMTDRSWLPTAAAPASRGSMLLRWKPAPPGRPEGARMAP